MRLKPKAALSLGMVLHELATNAAKHGALSAERGRVEVAWSAEGEGPAGRLVLRWAESGGPRVAQDKPERRGFGSELIERQLRHGLGGTYEAEFAEAGLRATLSLPLAATTTGPSRGGDARDAAPVPSAERPGTTGGGAVRLPDAAEGPGR